MEDTIQLLLEKLSNKEEDRRHLSTAIAAHINELMQHDFNRLLLILYRIDVSEQLLKATLAKSEGKDAGELIADLLIKRQEEKLASRQDFPPAKDISDDERW